MNSLYAPWRSCTFGALAVKFLRDKDTLNGLQDFTNSTMAMPWEQVETSIGDANILALRGDYTRGTCPIEPAHIVTCADIGQDKQHWATVAFDTTGQSFVLDYGTTLTIEDLLADSPRRLTTQKAWMIFGKSSASNHFPDAKKLVAARRACVHAALRASKIIFIFLKKVVDEKSSRG